VAGTGKNDAFAVVWVGSRRRGSEYCYSIKALELI
jgi:hypothetical protein